MKKIRKILIANRSEIARRLIHACREMSITSVAIYSPADAASLVVQEADEAYLLEGEEVSETYLNITQILKIAQQCQADAIHPGYGFLSENAGFAEACEKVGIKFIGPSSSLIRKLGDKIEAKLLAEKAQVPTVPGYRGSFENLKELIPLVEKIGYPILIKAAAGGGGKGMRVVRRAEDLQPAIQAAQHEAQAFFKDDRIFLEKYLENPRHLEVQILGDEQGNVLHLYERECSLQRRHQKIVEESPSPSIPPSVREALCVAAKQLAQEAGYFSAGTVEFVVDADNHFYFLEVNTRLQVEHPVTEAVTGIDLVQAQIRIAQGETLPWIQEEIISRGHSLQCRLYAEDPENEFLPSEGQVQFLLEPQRPGVRIDSGLALGQKIETLYDPMLAKLIVYASSRKEALMKMSALLQDYTLLGLRHNLDFLKFAVDSPLFHSGFYNTNSAAALLQEFLQVSLNSPSEILALAALVARSAPKILNSRSISRIQAPEKNHLENFKNS